MNKPSVRFPCMKEVGEVCSVQLDRIAILWGSLGSKKAAIVRA